MLRDLVIRYLTQECNNPNPTDKDIDDHINDGIQVYGSKDLLLAALMIYFGK